MDLNFYIADLTRPGINWNDRAKVTGRLGNYMVSVARLLHGQFSAVEIHWIGPKYAPSLGDTDILVYVIPTIDWSVIKANGGNVSVAMTNSKIAGLTDVTNVQPISELYWIGCLVGRNWLAPLFMRRRITNRNKTWKCTINKTAS